MSLYTEKSSRIRLANRIKNMKGRSTLSEVDPSILAPKGAVHLRMKISDMISLPFFGVAFAKVKVKMGRVNV
jgi:hypothetical protein